jgi:hypothetical protein
MDFLNVEDFSIIEERLYNIESDILSITRFYKEDELCIFLDNDMLFGMVNLDIVVLEVLYYGDYNTDEKAIFLLGLNNLLKGYEIKLIDLEKENEENLK